MTTIAISVATDREIDPLVLAFQAEKVDIGIPFETFINERGAARVIILRTGIGKAAAAAATASLILSRRPDLIINTGCGGASPASGLSTGNLAIATGEIFADDGVETPAGWRSMEQVGLGIAEYGNARLHNRIPLSPKSAADACLLAASLGIPFHAGMFLTVSTCSGATNRGEEIVSRFEGICENMEGAAVALTASLYEVDCLEVRGISNLVEDRDLSRWDIPAAMSAVTAFMTKLIERITVR
jgi:futalosine hydrolase